jgi:hypothetical protein
MQSTSSNPLSKHFRQPKIFLTLPSKGAFYDDAALTMPETQQLSVLAMTAKDELTIKTPDALLNGQSTVSVIQSCLPDIHNAWNCPSIDMDAILIAIRIATYGENMDLKVTVPGINEERTYAFNLLGALDNLVEQEFSNLLQYGEFSFEIAPLTYKQFTSIAMRTFEERRVFAVINDDDMSEEEKIEKFNESFERLTDINIQSLLSSVKSITIDGETVSNQEHIAEFFDNAEKELYKAVLDHIEEQRKKFTVQPLDVELPDDDVERGAPRTLQIPITFDQSDFFA